MNADGHQLAVERFVYLTNGPMRYASCAQACFHGQQLRLRASVERHGVGVFGERDAAGGFSGGVDDLGDLHAVREILAHDDVVSEDRGSWGGIKRRNES